MNGEHEKEFTFTNTGESEEEIRTIPVETPERVAQDESASKRDVSTSKRGGLTGLLDGGDAERLRARWTEIQAKFVDEPRASVSEADALISEAIQQILQRVNDEMHNLENQWSKGEEVSTEDLRQVLQHYRSFFHNLVD